MLLVPSQSGTVLWGLWYVNFTRGEYPVAIQQGKRLLETASNGGDTGQLLEAHHSLWPTLFGMGRPADAIPHMEQGLALYDRQRHGTSAFLYAGHDPGACCLWHYGMARWLMGYPDMAVRDSRDSLRLAEELAHPGTIVIALWFKAWIEYRRGEREVAVANLDRAMSIGMQYGLMLWVAASDVLLQMITQEHASAERIAELHRQVVSINQLTSWRRIACLFMLAELCLHSKHADAGLQALQSIQEDQRGTHAAPELLRLEGELILMRKPSEVARAQQYFCDAVKLARGREEKSLELRAAMSLARLLDQHGRREEAHAALAPVYGWFTEGFDTADLKAAKSLLDALA